MNKIDQTLLEKHARNECSKDEILTIKTWLKTSNEQSIIPADLLEAKSSTWIKIESSTLKKGAFANYVAIIFTLLTSIIIAFIISNNT